MTAMRATLAHLRCFLRRYFEHVLTSQQGATAQVNDGLWAPESGRLPDGYLVSPSAACFKYQQQELTSTFFSSVV